MKQKTMLVAVFVVALLGACSFLQRKAGDRIAAFFGNGVAQYAECEDPKKVVKWAQGICSSFGACTEPTGPLTGAILKPLVDKFVPAGVDWVKPAAWGACKMSKPKDGLKNFLYGLIDMLPVDGI